LRQETFDLGVLDHGLPDMTGTELAARIRAYPGTSDLPVIMVTARAYELDEAELRESLGILRVIAKPFSPREVAAIIHAALAMQWTAA
jgi:DNA-binding response OmpR family regulator